MEIAVDRLGGDTRIPRSFYSIKISRLRRKAALCAAPLSTVSTNSQMIRLHFPARGLALNTRSRTFCICSPFETLRDSESWLDLSAGRRERGKFIYH